MPVGAMAGALSVARGERLAAGAEWSPYSQRQALVAEVHAVRQVARATRRHHDPTNPALAPALGIAYPGGDLYPWLRKRGRITEVVIPEREQRLAMAVLGIPGSGKTVTLLRRVWIAARAGMRVVFVDCKGTDPGLAWQVTCAYRLANPGAIVGFWPTQPLDCWRGDGMAIANRLLAVEDWASRRGRPLLPADGHPGPPAGLHTHPPAHPATARTSCAASTSGSSRQLWRGDPTAQADLEQLAADPHVLAGVRGRYSAFFRSLAGTADGCWGLEDVDLAVLTIPTIASRTDADAAVRLVLEDLGHFATKRKARVGDDVLLVLDEFSAVQGGTDQAIHLAERLRDVGVPVIFGAQSPEGLGDERQQWRLLHTIGGGLVLHQTGRPRPSWSAWPGRCGPPSRPGSWMPGGRPARPACTWPTGPGSTPTRSASSTPARPSSSRPAAPSSSRVLQAPVPAQVQEEASALRAAAMSAAEPVYVAEGIVGAPPQVELWRPNQPALDQPDQPTPLPALSRTQEATARPPSRQGRRPCRPLPAPAHPARPPPGRRRTATRPPSPPSSRPASASNPTGTPPPSCNAFGPSAAGDAGGDGPASPAGWPGSPTWGGCAVADPTLAQGRRLARNLTSNSANNPSASPNATNATRFLTLHTSTCGRPTAGASLPRRPPALANPDAGPGPRGARDRPCRCAAGWEPCTQPARPICWQTGE